MWRVVAIALLVSGCGYALAGKGSTIPSYIKRIGVPTFQNLTPYPDLDRLFAEAVRVELQGHRQFVVVPDATGVDAVLNVSIQSLTLTLQAVTSDTRQASAYSLSVVVSGEFKDLKGNTNLWKNPTMRMADEYQLPNNVSTSDLASLFAQDPNALERISKRFAERIVAAMLTAF
jgi:outer membrane lipopolysaccharide assembly protein LptE/RlpB